MVVRIANLSLVTRDLPWLLNLSSGLVPESHVVVWTVENDLGEAARPHEYLVGGGNLYFVRYTNASILARCFYSFLSLPLSPFI